MKRVYKKSKYIVLVDPNGCRREITQKNLLIGIKMLLAIFRREKYMALCTCIYDMGYTSLHWNTVDCVKLYIQKYAPPIEEHDGGYWWPRNDREARISFLKARISELETQIQESK